MTQQDSALLDHIIRMCEAESALYTKRIQENANFTCEFADKSKRRQQHDAGADVDGGFANSKGSVVHDTDDGGGGGDDGANDDDDNDEERYRQASSSRNSSSRSLAEANERRARKFADLMAWLGRSGAFMPQVGVCEVGEAGFAVFSKTDIAESRAVLKIPLSCLVTDTLAAGTPTGRLLADLRGKVAALAHCQLSVFLLEDMERGRKSSFHAYYQSLPQQLPQHSLFWTTEEKSLLRGTCFLDDVQSFELMVKTDYETIVNRLPAFGRFSFAKFLWSRIIVSSRNFSIRINHSDHIALVPLADMMNHHEPRRTAWEYRDDDRAFVITSLDSFGAGSQITNRYDHNTVLKLRFVAAWAVCVELKNSVLAAAACRALLQLRLFFFCFLFFVLNFFQFSFCLFARQINRVTCSLVVPPPICLSRAAATVKRALPSCCFTTGSSPTILGRIAWS